MNFFLKYYLSLILFFMTFLFNVVFAQTLDTISLESKRIEINNSKNELFRLNELAKQEYMHMQTHPKLVKTSDFSDSLKLQELSIFQYFIIEYDARKIEYNSLFVKKIVENDLVKFVHFSPTKALIWADKTLDKSNFIKDLNDVSMTIISERVDDNYMDK